MLPKVSVIIPARPGAPIRALAALQAADYPPERLEILVVEGECPPHQRNVAARQASGDVIYFLDDDSIVVPDTLQRIARHYGSPDVHLVGGPSLAPANGPFLSRCIGYVLGTRLGAWTMRARYASVGGCRPATEKELIGCNLSIRREAFQALGGFREDLFPNEETELVSRWQRQGGSATYDPQLIVWRSHRHSFAALAQQFFGYGRGRLRQMLRTSSHTHLEFLWPAIGLAYLALSPLLAWGIGPWALLPVVTYLAVVVSVSAYLGLAHRLWAGSLLLPILFGSIHTFYGWGLIYEALIRWRMIFGPIHWRLMTTDAPRSRG